MTADPSASMSPPTKKKHSLPEVLFAYWPLVLVAVGLPLYLGIRTFLFEPFRTPSKSMEPTLTRNTVFFVSKWGFGNYEIFSKQVARRPRSAAIARGHVFVVRGRQTGSAAYVWRVVGLPGDHVRYFDHRLTINGQESPLRLVENLGAAQMYEEEIEGVRFRVLFMGGGRNFDGRVPPGRYFMMGDSRDNSRDSRYVGFVPEGDIVGRLVWVVIRPPMTEY